MAIVRADLVFTRAAGFTAEEIRRVMAAGAGKTVAFASQKAKAKSQKARPEAILVCYARGWSPDETAEQCGCSRRWVYRIIRKEREEGLKGSRVEEWKKRGLSLREVGRIYGKSHETARKAISDERGVMSSE